MPGKKSSRPKNVRYCYDESLPPKIGEILSHVGFPIELARPGTQDEQLIPWMGTRGQTWITKDNRARVEHEQDILEANISIVWIRGLTHERRKKGSIGQKVGMKDILRMLVNKLDGITEIIGAANGPRYLLLYMTKGKNIVIEPFPTLREVWKRLALG